ncbi:MAG: hypothetical protein BM556_12930 [Bacteriovorax sp. MedPE-SWde]|nr:MAG: hypothetical protein BM556_12930 [Bacteriovorax sp. MedPE-SWde]
MKVASFALIFSLFLFLFTAVVTYSHASDSSSLYLKGHVPNYFGLEYSYSNKGPSVRPKTNFPFYGSVTETDAKLSSTGVIKGQNSHYKVVSIIIN